MRQHLPQPQGIHLAGDGNALPRKVVPSAHLPLETPHIDVGAYHLQRRARSFCPSLHRSRSDVGPAPELRQSGAGYAGLAHHLPAAMPTGCLVTLVCEQAGADSGNIGNALAIRPHGSDGYGFRCRRRATACPPVHPVHCHHRQNYRKESKQAGFAPDEHLIPALRRM